jgi:hypothetical protein
LKMPFFIVTLPTFFRPGIWTTETPCCRRCGN